MVGLALLGGAWAENVRAADAALEPSTLRWVRAPGAESCPDELEMARAVERRLGRPAFVPAEQARLSLETVIERAPAGGFRARITLVRGDAVVGQRELEGAEPECAALAAKVALALAITIDPDAPLSDPAPEPQPEPEPPPPLAPPPPPVVRQAPPPPPPPAPKPEPFQGDFEVAAAVATGMVPHLAPGVFVRGRVLPPGLPFGAEIEGAYFPNKALESAPGKGADFALWFAGLSICTRPPRDSRITASACVGADAGSVVGQGYGFDYSPDFQSPVFLLGARSRLWIRPFSGVAVVVGPDITIPLVRDHFQTRTPAGTHELFRMSAVGFAFELGVVLEL